jgi:CRP-like cAMP-binding protein
MAHLEQIELFSGCTRRQLREVARRLYPVEVQRGHVLVRSGDACEELVVVVDGEAATRDPDGRCGSLGPGSVFGEAAVLHEGAQRLTVASTTSMRLLVASRTELGEIVRINPSVERDLLRRVALASTGGVSSPGRHGGPAASAR